MSDQDQPSYPYFFMRAGRNGSREYLAPDWKPGDPPVRIVPREFARKQQADVRKNGRPRALTTNQALQVIACAHTLKNDFVWPGTDRVNVNKMAREISTLMFQGDANLARDEHVRQLIRTLGLAE